MLLDGRPLLHGRLTENFENLVDLVRLERVSVVAFALLLRALEERFRSDEFCENAANRPHVDCLRVVFRAEEQLRGAVPDGDDDRVDVRQRAQRRLEEAGQAEVGDFDATALGWGFVGAGYENVGWFEVAVDYPVHVEVVHSLQDLPEKGLDGLHWHRLCLCISTAQLEKTHRKRVSELCMHAE